jgi:hypothetical protein
MTDPRQHQGREFASDDYSVLGTTLPDHRVEEPVPVGDLLTGPNRDAAQAGHLSDPGSGPMPPEPTDPTPHYQEPGLDAWAREAAQTIKNFEVAGALGVDADPETLNTGTIKPGQPTVEGSSGTGTADGDADE